MPDDPNIWREAAGIGDLAAKVLAAHEFAVSSQTEFETAFKPHLEELISPPDEKRRKQRDGRETITQNRKQEISEDVSRKAAELYVACLAIHIGPIELEDPVKSSGGKNPDVLFWHGSKRWRICAKTLSTKWGQAIFEHTKRGCEQIQASGYDGFVLINLKDALDHDAPWDRPFESVQDAVQALRRQLAGAAHKTGENRPDSDWARVFQACPRAKLPVVFMGQSLARIRIDLQGTGVSFKIPIRAMHWEDWSMESNTEVKAIVIQMNEWMQHIQSEHVKHFETARSRIY